MALSVLRLLRNELGSILKEEAIA